MPIITFVDHTIPVAADFNDSYSFINTEVRTYERGGTGLSSYTKGDILYASAANTVAKLAIGVYGALLAVGSTGIPSWSQRVLLKNGTNGTDSAGTGYSVSIPANALGTKNRVHARLIFGLTNNSGGNITFTSSIIYNSVTVASYADVVATGVTDLAYPVTYDLCADESASAQLGVVRVADSATTPSIGAGTASQDSTAAHTLTFQMDAAPTTGSITVKYAMAELLI